MLDDVYMFTDSGSGLSTHMIEFIVSRLVDRAPLC